MSPTGQVSPVVCHINLARGFRGGERQTELLIMALARQGVKQRLLARKGEPLAARFKDVADVDVVEVGSPLLSGLAYCRNVDILQVHEAKAGHLACIANSLYGTHYVITRRVDKPPKASWANRRLYKRAAGVVAVSSAISSILTGKFPGLHVDTIHDAHSDLPYTKEKVAEIKQTYPGKFLLGHAGALVNRHKGQLYLIRAMRRLQPDYPDLHLLLLGRGEDEAMLKAEAKELSNLSFPGFTDRLGDYLHALDMFVFPSLNEGLGSVLLDAMHAGLPVIATRVGGIPDIVKHGENGLLVPPENEEALARAIGELYEDPQRRQELAESGRQFSTAYSPQAMAGKYIDLYKRILESQ